MSMALQWSSWYAGVVRGRGCRDAVMTTQQCRGGDVWNRGGKLLVASGTSLVGQVAEVGEWARLSLGVRASAAPTSSI